MTNPMQEEELSVLDIQEGGYVYMLREREFVRLNENTVKIGKTTRRPHSRLTNYPKNSEIIFVKQVDNCHTKETELLKNFKKRFVWMKEYGLEYYYCDSLEDMKTTFLAIVQDEYDESCGDEEIEQNNIKKPWPKRIKKTKIINDNEKNFQLELGLCEDLEYSNAPKKIAQLKYINEICSWFKLKNSRDSQEITSEDILSFQFSSLNKVINLFNVKPSSNTQKSDGMIRQANVAFINRVLKEWSGSKIETVVKQKRIKKEKLRIYSFRLTFHNTEE